MFLIDQLKEVEEVADELRLTLALIEAAQALRAEIGSSGKDVVMAAIDGEVLRRFTTALQALEGSQPEGKSVG